MSLIKESEKYLQEVIQELGYEIDKVVLEPSNRRELGEFQLNAAFSLALATVQDWGYSPILMKIPIREGMYLIRSMHRAVKPWLLKRLLKN